MVRKALSLEEAFGSVPPSKRPEDFKALCRLAKDEKAATPAKMRDLDRVAQVEREEP